MPTGTESAERDRRAIEDHGVPSSVLMENAGRSAALVLERLFDRRSGPVAVFAGSGNNGGDGVVLARTLTALGRDVELFVVGERPDPDPLLHSWDVARRAAPDSDDALEGVLDGASVVVDAMLGTGVRGEPRPPHSRVIEAVNRASAPVVALDVPSGVNADTGAVAGAAIRADVTVGFGSPKLGSVLPPARSLTGRLICVEIGFPPFEPAGGRLITSSWAHEHRPRRSPVTHKKAEGWVLILAGGPGSAGAAVLAARGALRAGAGYVQVASIPENRPVLQTAVPEALFVNAHDDAALLEAARGCDVLAAGPGMGLGEAEAERLERLLVEADLEGVVLDADALTLLGAGRLPAFRDVATPKRRLLTPHPGEMVRLGAGREAIRDDPVTVCRDGASRWASALLLKGTPSLVQGPERGPVRVSATGSSDLARAGMGDVLTGVAAAFLARGVDAADAGALALHFTGRAAAAAGKEEALLPSDVTDALPDALTAAEPETDLALPFVTLDLDLPR